jgi:hypothetical protein
VLGSLLYLLGIGVSAVGAGIGLNARFLLGCFLGYGTVTPFMLRVSYLSVTYGTGLKVMCFIRTEGIAYGMLLGGASYRLVTNGTGLEMGLCIGGILL